MVRSVNRIWWDLSIVWTRYITACLFSLPAQPTIGSQRYRPHQLRFSEMSAQTQRHVWCQVNTTNIIYAFAPSFGYRRSTLLPGSFHRCVQRDLQRLRGLCETYSDAFQGWSDKPHKSVFFCRLPSTAIADKTRRLSTKRLWYGNT